jgi:hypothetical protein
VRTLSPPPPHPTTTTTTPPPSHCHHPRAFPSSHPPNASASPWRAPVRRRVPAVEHDGHHGRAPLVATARLPHRKPVSHLGSNSAHAGRQGPTQQPATHTCVRLALDRASVQKAATLILAVIDKVLGVDSTPKQASCALVLTS